MKIQNLINLVRILFIALITPVLTIDVIMWVFAMNILVIAAALFIFATALEFIATFIINIWERLEEKTTN